MGKAVPIVQQYAISTQLRRFPPWGLYAITSRYFSRPRPHEHSPLSHIMDRIEPNSSHSQVHRQTTPDSRGAEKAERKPDPADAKSKVSAYSDVFDDQELERLQNNLQSVSELASKALERFKK